MNLSKLFEIQMELDECIENKHPEIKNKNNLDWKILALLVELGECANEWRGFKKWSNDQETRTEKMLEEYVDCLHFILSIGLEINYDTNKEFNVNENSYKDVLTYFNETFLSIGLFYYNRKDYDYSDLVVNLLDLGTYLGFTWEQIEKAFIDKTEISYQRQNNGY